MREDIFLAYAHAICHARLSMYLSSVCLPVRLFVVGNVIPHVVNSTCELSKNNFKIRSLLNAMALFTPLIFLAYTGTMMITNIEK